jgi:hypothetical protein
VNTDQPSKLPTVLPGRAAPRLLSRQDALVTGANTGIGRAIAEAGADVMLN